MKQKKPYIKINLDKENPLKTIAKMGKIPVIRRSKDGFHNYDQKEYFDHYSAKFKDTTPPKGCFCLLGGIFGHWVTGSHWKEPLHIGYVEPDTPVMATYAFDDKLGWRWVTAKERYADAMKTFIHDFNCGINTQYDLEDFELSEEAIIDSKYITHVATIKYEDYYKLIRFANDSMNTLFEDVSLIDCIELPEQVLRRYNVSTHDEFKKLFLINPEKDNDEYYFDSFQQLKHSIINDLREFVINHNTSTAWHTLMFLQACKTNPLFSLGTAERWNSTSAKLEETVPAYNELMKLFPLFKERHNYIHITSTDVYFSIKFYPDWWTKYYTQYHSTDTVSISYMTADRKLTITSEHNKFDSHSHTEYKTTENLPDNIQQCLLFFTAAFDIYMNHFHMFFHIRPFDEYYLYHDIIHVIKYCRQYDYDYQLHDTMTGITIHGKINSVDYDFILQSGNICEKQPVTMNNDNTAYHNTYKPIEGPVDKILADMPAL